MGEMKCYILLRARVAPNVRRKLTTLDTYYKSAA